MSMIQEDMAAQKNKPFVVSIMGQTGVGKTSLLNALFNTKLKVDAVRPTTKVMQRVEVKTTKGHKIIFCDMPGIGESGEVDSAYMSDYRQQLLESDVVLWAIHADNRSTAFDVQAIAHLLEGMEPEQRSDLMSKMTFVLTKADLLMQSPWGAGFMDGYVTFAPENETKNVLEQKATYYQELYIHPYGADIVARTYHDGTFAIDEPSITFNEYAVYYHGLLTNDRRDDLKKRHPEYDRIFDHLYNCYRVIPCSALFKYNLPTLMLVITSKLGREVFESFKQVVNIGSQSIDIALLDRVQLEQMLKMSNFTIWDVQSKNKVFDLGKGIFPNEKFQRWFRTPVPKRRGKLRGLLGGFFV